MVKYYGIYKRCDALEKDIFMRFRDLARMQSSEKNCACDAVDDKASACLHHLNYMESFLEMIEIAQVSIKHG